MRSRKHDEAAADTTTYVLVTGANNGLGFSICTRLITTFLRTNPSSSQCLHLIPTTRSRAKADATVARLQRHVEELVSGKVLPDIFIGSPSPPAWASDLDTTTPGSQSTLLPGPPSEEERAQWARRISIEPLLLDLTSLPTVYAAARELRSKYVRLDVVICNAGIGGWLGVDWIGALKQFFTKGLSSVINKPAFKMGTLGSVTSRQIQRTTSADTKGSEKDGGDEEPKLGEVFCANLFGHYVLVHEAMGLLSRPQSGEQELGRVIWLSTIEAMGSSFSVDDLQGLKTVAAYESSKRATDILFLGANLSSTQPYVQSYLTAPADITTAKTTQANDQDTPVKPRIFTCHPGICATSIMPLHPLLVYAQLFAFFLVRVLGNSPWLVTTADKGATAPVWLALETSTKLGEAQAAKKKWGSRVDRWGREGVMESEVDEIGDGLAGEVWARTELLRREWEGRCRAG